MVENKSLPLVILVSVFCGLATISTTARCYVRIKLVKVFGLDDYLTVAATLTFWWFTASVLLAAHYGTGRHMWDLSLSDAMQALRGWWVCYLAYAITMMLVKVAIGLFFLRVSVTKLQIGIVWFTIAHSIVAGIIFLFVVAFQCQPASYFWNKVYPDAIGTCLPHHVFTSLGYLYGSAAALGDLTYGLLPILLVWNLDIGRRAKIVLVPIIGMAGIASCAVFVRMAYMQTIVSDDFLWDSFQVALWSTVEPGLALTASNMATLRPLFRAFLDRLTSAEPSMQFQDQPKKFANSSSSHKMSQLAPPPPIRSRKNTFSAEITAASGPGQSFNLWSAFPSRAASSQNLNGAENDAASLRADSDIITFVNEEAQNRQEIFVKTEFEIHESSAFDGATLRSESNPGTPMSPRFPPMGPPSPGPRTLMRPQSAGLGMGTPLGSHPVDERDEWLQSDVERGPE